MYRSILVPLDGEVASEHALPVALSIARRCGADITLATVYTGSPNDIKAQEQARVYLDRLLHLLPKAPDVAFQRAQLCGPVAETLAEYVRECEMDLVVMTSNPRGLLSKLWSGSVTDQFARQSPAPVLIVHPRGDDADFERDVVFDHILVNVDGPMGNDEIVEPTLALAGLMGAEVTLLRVTPNRTQLNIGSPDMPVYSERDDQSLAEEMRAEAKDYLEAVAEPFRAQSLTVQTEAVIDEPGDEVLEYSQRLGVKLVAMTTRGRSEMSRWLLGRVTDKALRTAGLALLLYHV